LSHFEFKILLLLLNKFNEQPLNVETNKSAKNLAYYLPSRISADICYWSCKKWLRSHSGAERSI